MDLLEPARERVAWIERAAADALAPAEELVVDGWRLRFNHGVTRRGKSALAERAAARPLARTLREVTSFYRDRGVPARIQLSPASRPSGLDAALAVRGWRHEPGAQVLWTAVRELGPSDSVPATAADAWLEIEEAPGAAYRAVQAVTSPGVEAWAAARADALQAAGLVPWHLLLRTPDGDGLAAGLAVFDPPSGLVGLFSLATRPDARGRGLGSRLIREALRRSRSAGALGAYLQVDARNEAARRLYLRLGFRPHHAYHYRRAPTAPDDAS